MPFATPQGRNVTQWGFVDDVNHVRGNHSIKAGFNFARYDISTHGPGQGTLPLVGSETLTDFFNGMGTTYTQSFPTRLEQPVNLYDLGFYGQDTWRVKSNLSLTFAVRADRYSNPSCTTNCFSRFNNDFLDVAHDVNHPLQSNHRLGTESCSAGLSSLAQFNRALVLTSVLSERVQTW